MGCIVGLSEIEPVVNSGYIANDIPCNSLKRAFG